MNFPTTFDPSAVTEISLNVAYFANVEDQDVAEATAAKHFPNAEIVWFNFEEDPGMGVVKIEPDLLPTDEMVAVYDALEDELPQGPFRGLKVGERWGAKDDDEPRATEVGDWAAPHPDAWKSAD